MDDFQPLSVRRGKRAPMPIEEGIPQRLRYPIRYWLEGEFGYRSQRGMSRSSIQYVALRLGIPLSGTDSVDHMRQLLVAGDRDDDLLLDIIDALLADTAGSRRANADEMRRILDVGRSAWRVSERGDQLEWRVEPAAIQRMADAASSGDRASAELAEAWSKAYGLNPDPADAWDHAIKAVEEVLIPLVIPGKDKANLGGVAGELASNAKWRLEAGNELADTARRQHLDSARTLEAMLRLLWPDPQRHGGGGATPQATQLQAESMVQLAITIVQWVRSGALSKSP